MSTFSVELGVCVTGRPPLTEAELEDALDRVLDELEKLDGITDAGYGGSLDTGLINFSAFVDCEDFSDAIAKLSADLRTAVHAAEGMTPGWPSFSRLSANAQLIDPSKLVSA